MRYSRTVGTASERYASSTAVVSMEVLKFLTCLAVIAYERGGGRGLLHAVRTDLFAQPVEVLKLAVPSIMYSIQNNLLYYALSHLDAATFQVGYQLKILTTAFFSFVMLNKRQSSMQILSLCLLTLGVSLAQLSSTSSQRGTAEDQRNSWLGLLAVFLAACSSGFAGVYFEKLLKNAATSLWMRNIQMGVSSIVAAVLGIYFSGEGESVRTRGFFAGYSSLVIMVILLQAVGGLIVAVVVKYADNILKGFAASFSIVTACLLSYCFFDFKPSLLFTIGAALVLLAMYLYAKYPLGKQEDAPPTTTTTSSSSSTSSSVSTMVGGGGVSSSGVGRGGYDSV
eukprot:scaffold2308_cov164-Ochromonas_danica.AAC.4